MYDKAAGIFGIFVMMGILAIRKKIVIKKNENNPSVRLGITAASGRVLLWAEKLGAGLWAGLLSWNCQLELAVMEMPTLNLLSWNCL
jgi:hypothetical protein